MGDRFCHHSMSGATLIGRSRLPAITRDYPRSASRSSEPSASSPAMSSSWPSSVTKREKSSNRTRTWPWATATESPSPRAGVSTERSPAPLLAPRRQRSEPNEHQPRARRQLRPCSCTARCRRIGRRRSFDCLGAAASMASCCREARVVAGCRQRDRDSATPSFSERNR